MVRGRRAHVPPAEQAAADWQDGAVVDLHREMMRLTLKIAVRTLFNVEPDGIREISQAGAGTDMTPEICFPCC